MQIKEIYNPTIIESQEKITGYQALPGWPFNQFDLEFVHIFVRKKLYEFAYRIANADPEQLPRIVETRQTLCPI